MNHYYENQLETRLYYTNVLTYEKKNALYTPLCGTQLLLLECVYSQSLVL